MVARRAASYGRAARQTRLSRACARAAVMTMPSAGISSQPRLATGRAWRSGAIPARSSTVRRRSTVMVTATRLHGTSSASQGASIGAARNQAVTPEESDWSLEGEDVAIFLHTSGTSGDPKVAVLRQRHLVSYVLGSVEFLGAEEDEATLVSVPPYHIAGMSAIREER